MIVEEFEYFGGRHFDSAALGHLLAHHGVLDPRSRAPLSEPLLFALGGGAGAGVSHCPSVAREGLGAGLTLLGRDLLQNFDGAFVRGALDRLGVAFEMAETSSPKAGTAELIEQLKQGRPCLVWCTRSLPYLGVEPALASLNLAVWSVVVYGFDPKAKVLQVSDLAPARVEVALEALERARSGIKAHRQRSLFLKPRDKSTRPLSASRLCDAVIDGLRQAVAGQRRPKIKAFSLIGLSELARSVSNLQSKQGWYRSFPGGKLYWPLKELFASIEAEGSDGSFHRELWATALLEASDLTKKPALKPCAELWRELATLWREVADMALGDQVPAFARTKALLRQRRDLFLQAAQLPMAELTRIDQQLALVEATVVERLPLESESAQSLLLALGKRLEALVAREQSAFDLLAKAVA